MEERSGSISPMLGRMCRDPRKVEYRRKVSVEFNMTNEAFCELSIN
jgi:hypothetical protein